MRDVNKIKLERVTKHVCSRRGQLTKNAYKDYSAMNKIINSYFSIAFETIVNGYSWKLPYGFGRMYIQKNELEWGDTGTGCDCFPVGFNTLYRVILGDGRIDKREYKFSPSNKLIGMIKGRLNEYFDYRTTKPLK